MAVLMYPGDRVFTLMPYWPHSCATDRHSCCTAALLLLYAEHVNPWKERCQRLSKYTQADRSGRGARRYIRRRAQDLRGWQYHLT